MSFHDQNMKWIVRGALVVIVLIELTVLSLKYRDLLKEKELLAQEYKTLAQLQQLVCPTFAHQL